MKITRTVALVGWILTLVMAVGTFVFGVWAIKNGYGNFGVYVLSFLFTTCVAYGNILLFQRSRQTFRALFHGSPK